MNPLYWSCSSLIRIAAAVMALSKMPLRLILSYLFDWVVVMYDTSLPTVHNLTNICYSIVAAGGGVLNYISGYHRPFSLTDITISYPNEDNIVSIPVLISIALVAPAGIILVFSLLAHFLGITSYNPHHRRWLQTL